ncbi:MULTISPECIES: WXG100 family type VII secretion target [Streptomyces]|uniref:Outer membrane channel protein CpnT-like N-terminal domain-containing protein n=1 Tax=Streptomyces harbinensis TaxID=1176198 RepID=A0A1I6UUA4_9ACTN|nr:MULTISPECIES: hypothetical protein [Streptomyces]SFT04904.1 hypothetical protein SAMN05444716_106188 [Streptomyces harbinensis]
MSQEIDVLRERARDLRDLARDVDGLMTAARDYARDSMESWEGPNATDVRGDLDSWNTKCGEVAEALRQEATNCDNEADDLEEEQNEDG